ncbi:IS110 family transposase [Candidatus Poribacteria bacterium]|jgi:transposase|nr:IS110 family transposase [Candidatus Poribacteria bacterium]
MAGTTKNSSRPVLGIDIAKKTFDAALLRGEKLSVRGFDNNAKGFAKLSRWVDGQGVDQFHACMESTGVYWEPLANHLHQAQQRVSVVNPLRIHGFAKSELARNKTDREDAARIARFCQLHAPYPWQPLPAERRKLRDLTRHLHAVRKARHQHRNRREGTPPEWLLQSLKRTIAHFDEEIELLWKEIRAHIDGHPELKRQRELLETVSAFGEITATLLLAELPDIERFASARQVAAFAGVTPKHRHSGSSVRGRTQMSKMGQARIRHALYMPAIVARTHNPIARAFADRLEERGKCPMVIIGAIMRKLLHIAYGVLKSGKPFDPQHA